MVTSVSRSVRRLQRKSVLLALLLPAIIAGGTCSALAKEKQNTGGYYESFTAKQVKVGERKKDSEEEGYYANIPPTAPLKIENEMPSGTGDPQKLQTGGAGEPTLRYSPSAATATPAPLAPPAPPGLPGELVPPAPTKSAVSGISRAPNQQVTPPVVPAPVAPSAVASAGPPVNTKSVNLSSIKMPNPTLTSAIAVFNDRRFGPALAQFEYLDKHGQCNERTHYYIARCCQQLSQVDRAQRNYAWILTYGKDRQLRGYAQLGYQQLTRYSQRRTYEGNGNFFQPFRGGGAGAGGGCGG